MRIKFIPPDPRAGSIAQMDSFRGQQLVGDGAAVQIKEDGSDSAAAVMAPAPSNPLTVVPGPAATSLTPPAKTQKPSFGLTVEQIRAALQSKGIAIPEGVSRKAELATILDGAAE